LKTSSISRLPCRDQNHISEDLQFSCLCFHCFPDKTPAQFICINIEICGSTYLLMGVNFIEMNNPAWSKQKKYF